eukprot:1140346-Pelagomonas_calceolata.AAC.1
MELANPRCIPSAKRLDLEVADRATLMGPDYSSCTCKTGHGDIERSGEHSASRCQVCEVLSRGITH